MKTSPIDESVFAAVSAEMPHGYIYDPSRRLTRIEVAKIAERLSPKAKNTLLDVGSHSFYDSEFNPHDNKEYTRQELAQVLEFAGFQRIESFAFDCFFHLSLKKLGAVQAIGAPQEKLSQFGLGFNPWHPYEYARLFCLGITSRFPNLRTDILAIGQK